MPPSYNFNRYLITPTDTAWHSLDIYFTSAGGPNYFNWGDSPVDPTELGAIMVQVDGSTTSGSAFGLTVDNVSFE